MLHNTTLQEAMPEQHFLQRNFTTSTAAISNLARRYTAPATEHHIAMPFLDSCFCRITTPRLEIKPQV